MFIDRLRRISRDGSWIREIDGLRFVAIFSVFLFHLSGEVSNRGLFVSVLGPGLWPLGRLLDNGDRGVSVFFVLSGLVLALPFARHALLQAKPVRLRGYFLRRLTRLELPFVLSTLLAFTMIVVYLHHVPAGLIGHALATLGYQHSLIYGTPSPVNSVTWSLEVEIQYYLVAPLLMVWFRVRSAWVRRASMILGIAVIGLAQAPWAPSPRFSLSLLFYLQYFLAGLFMADIFVLDLKRISPSLLWDAVGLAALGFIFWPTHGAFWPHVLLPFPMGALCLAAMRSRVLRRILSNKWIAVIGGMCYSIYLLHFLLIATVFKVTRHLMLRSVSLAPNLVIQLVVTGLPVLLLCAVFFVLVERPCMNPQWPALLWHRLGRRSHTEVHARNM